jgi:hypothetical protein
MSMGAGNNMGRAALSCSRRTTRQQVVAVRLSDMMSDPISDPISDIWGCARKKGSPHCARAPLPFPVAPDTLHNVTKGCAASFGASDARRGHGGMVYMVESETVHGYSDSEPLLLGYCHADTGACWSRD